MDWRPIHISEIALYLLKAHNWKSPGNDQIQKYRLSEHTNITPIQQCYRQLDTSRQKYREKQEK